MCARVCVCVLQTDISSLRLILHLVSLHYAESTLVRKEQYLVIAALSVWLNV